MKCVPKCPCEIPGAGVYPMSVYYVMSAPTYEPDWAPNGDDTAGVPGTCLADNCGECGGPVGVGWIVHEYELMW